GCFSPTFLDGKTPCASDKECPSGLHCATDKTCWHAGKDPLADLSVIVQPDMIVATDGSNDLAVPTDLEPLADLTQPAPPDLTPVVKHQGETCGAGEICTGSSCVDGYCCNSPCTNTCQAC